MLVHYETRKGSPRGKKFNKGEWKDELNTCNMELERRERIQGRNIQLGRHRCVQDEAQPKESIYGNGKGQCIPLFPLY